MMDKAALRARAVSRVRSATNRLRAQNVEAKVIGSLARGTFDSGSDVDLLIVSCPPELKYAIEGQVEECMGNIAFDVIYLDEIPAHRLNGFTCDAIDANGLS